MIFQDHMVCKKCGAIVPNGILACVKCLVKSSPVTVDIKKLSRTTVGKKYTWEDIEEGMFK